MKLNDRGLLVVISGPSGVGKGTIRKALFNTPGHNFTYSISVTTRKPRQNEVDGVDYYFISKEKFQQMIENNEFLEYSEFVGNYYGTPIEHVEEALSSGKELIMEIEVNGCAQVREKMVDAVTIFIAPPSKEELYARLMQRGTENDKTINERIKKAEREFRLAYQYDYIVVNDDVDNAADRIMAIIRAEHAKTKRSIHSYYHMLEGK